MEAIMDAAFSFLISIGIIAFGVWIFASSIAAVSPLAWTLMRLLTAIVGLIGLYQATRDLKIA
jgi:hypothetical protein